MKESKGENQFDLSAKANSMDAEYAEKRREFIKKYGKLAAITPVALSLAMHSKAQIGSGGGSGGGTGGDGGPF
jgi:hypothetical protein